MGKGAQQQQETETQKASTDIALKTWNDFKTRIMPIQTKAVERGMDRDLGKSKGMAQIASGASKAASESRQQVAAGASARGINPNSGAVTGTVAQMGDVQGKGMGEGMTGYAQDREAQRTASAIDTVATTRQIEGQTMQGLDTLGNIEMRKNMAIQDAKDYADMSIGRTVGQAVGMGAGYYYGGGGGSSVSDAQLIANGGSVGARNAQQIVGVGMVP